jgi:hypothetical protein
MEFDMQRKRQQMKELASVSFNDFLKNIPRSTSKIAMDFVGRCMRQGHYALQDLFRNERTS